MSEKKCEGCPIGPPVKGLVRAACVACASKEIEPKWLKAQKRPLVVEFRKVRGYGEIITTPEGAKVPVYPNVHLVMRDEGGEYPILGTIFAKTYDVLPNWLPSHEPFWKSDLVGRIWAYARSSGIVLVDSARDDAGRETLPPGLSDLVRDIRSRCDRCGKTVKQAQIDENEPIMNPISTYQCCHIHSLTEDYTPKLCLECHNALKRIWPHETTSV